MNKLIGIIAALLIAGPVVAETPKEQLQRLLQNPYWSVTDYTNGFCAFQSYWVEDSINKGIAVDPNDDAIWQWIRDEFDANIKQLGVSVIGDRPSFEELLCI